MHKGRDAEEKKGKQPGWFHYSGDWMGCPELRRCSKGAIGCWIDMLCILDKNVVRGMFCDAGGVPWPDEEVARSIGGDIAENLQFIEELLRKQVVSRNQKGSIYSRRMVRDTEKRDQTAARKRKERRLTRSKQTNSVTQVVTRNVTQLSEEEIEREIESGSLSVKVVSDSVQVTELDCSKIKIMSTDFGAQASFAAGYILEHLDWTGRNARVTYEAQIVKQLKKLDGITAEQVAVAMVESWRLYQVASQGQQFKYGIASFFEKGIWCDRSQWRNGDEKPRLSNKAQAGRDALAGFREAEARRNSRVGDGNNGSDGGNPADDASTIPIR